MNTAWSSDWKRKALEQVKALGFETLIDYVNAREGRTFEELASELGSAVAPIQVEMLYLSEGRNSGRLVECAAECLARVIIERFRRGRGWGTGVRLEYRTTGALVDWKVSVMRDAGDAGLSEDKLNAISTALRDVVRPPAGWMPRNGKDPYIQRAFEIGLR